jgi:predicted outer membrane repeat protein
MNRRNTTSIGLVAALIAAGALCMPAHADIYRVDWQVEEPGNGGPTWDDAFDNLQDALEVAENNQGADDIWVAEGTYYPTERMDPEDPRSVTFHLDDPSPVKIYGGFPTGGGDNSLDARDIYANPTILSGDIDQDDAYGTFPDDIWDDRDDNAYHVLLGSRTADAMDGARIDGFTIIGGTADDTEDDEQQRGGGAARGGDMFVRCVFCWNRAKEGGGAFFANDNDVIIYNCRFYNNLTAAGEDTWDAGLGGAIRMSDIKDETEPEAIIVNCVFHNNRGRVVAVSTDDS